ncbi:MAG: ABC transporter ATP-binding protein [Anaerolineales bacterium]|nr:ABC transporter ATP-binding protein [Anaerolineales bacterium]
MDLSIETRQLSKAYGAVRAVDSVDLRVGRGEIYGFLGLNGAGKTTTIRALLGMIKPSAGSVRVMGEPVGPHGRGPWRRIGHMVERPSAYPDLTVRENLEIARRLQEYTDSSATDRVIGLLHLGEYAGRKAGTLSTGNLQCLALARALLHEPELVVLDEPANGLDPAGVVEIRGLLAGLAKEKGVTVFMSSHILTEVDRLADRIGIIHKGRLIEELRAGQLEELRARRLVVKTRDLPKAQQTLVRAGCDPKLADGSIYLGDERSINAPDRIAELLVGDCVPPTHLAVEQEDLEQHFLKLTH